MKSMTLLALPPLLVLSMSASWAERERFTVDNQTYRNECGSCHIAFPPQLLPAQSWRELLRALDEHFGSDASVDATAAREIERYLSANSGPAQSTRTPPLRITQTRWFVREHREVPDSRWKSAAVGSPANCGACHTQADRGDFSERTVRIPK